MSRLFPSGYNRYVYIAAVVCVLGVLGLAYLLPNLSGAVAWITFAGQILYIASVAASFGVGLWVILPEIFPLRIRGSAMSACTILHWSANLAVSLLFLPLIQAIGETATFWGYCAVAVGALRLRLLLNARDQRPELGGNRGRPARQSGSPQTEEVRSLRKLSPCDPRHTIEEVR